MAVKVGFISLGCPKNQVDSEMMLSKLVGAGYEITDEFYEADIVVVNTCAFIEDAKKEAIENILEMAELKKEGAVKKIVVMGCLPERYKEEIRGEIPEADAVAGLGDNDNIVGICESVMRDEIYEKFPDISAMPLSGERLPTTPPYWAYLKIAEGCSNNCSYCVIPKIRGPYRSRPPEELLAEAGKLAADGVKELILIAQDTTGYGEDLHSEKKLPELLQKLAGIENIKWIRLMYCYPDRITDELLDVMRENDKILPYIDLPFQHCDGKILKAMNRKTESGKPLEIIEKIREKLPGAVIRTTLMTGFPGEGDEEFENLCDFVREAKFDRLGCFAYSREEGTEAYDMENRVEDDIKARRGEIIMDIQYGIFKEKQEARIGETVESIVEGYDKYSDSYEGRAWTDAPEIDGRIKFTSKNRLDDGDIVKVRIFDALEYDLIGEAI